MAVDYKLIGARVKSERKRCGLTQEKLADELSVTVGYVSQIERGITKANLDMLSEIARILNCNITIFLSGASESDKNYLTDEISTKAAALSVSEKNMLLDIMEVLSKYSKTE
ncbi:MAG: helix-turn-helix transcriptional regulator [Clostridia bacterium]|nr:helix-turn-helix transcriptional regulator [Clostridia bacterium]